MDSNIKFIDLTKTNTMKTKIKAYFFYGFFTILMLWASEALSQPFIGLTGGTNTKELTFGADATYLLKDTAYGEFDYFYSNEKEIFSLHIGLVPWHTDNFKLLVGFGTELNNDFNGKVSTSFMARISDITWATAGVESVNNNAYFSIGLKLGFVLGKIGKPKRFF